MALLETALITSLAPAVIEAVKTLFGGLSRKIGGMSVDDEIKLMEADTNRLKGLAELDNPVGTPSQWVVDMRASFRYIAAGAMVVIGASIAIMGLTGNVPEAVEIGASIAAAPMSFIIGERFVLKFKK